jgi:hypothetical protein
MIDETIAPVSSSRYVGMKKLPEHMVVALREAETEWQRRKDEVIRSLAILLIENPVRRN